MSTMIPSKTPIITSCAGDIVQQINGNFGRWQLRTILLIFLCKIPTAWFMACIIYTAPAPRQNELVCRPAWNETELETSSRSQQVDSQWSEARNTDRHFNIDICSSYAHSLTHRYMEHHRHDLNMSAKELEQLPNPHFCAHVKDQKDYQSLVMQFDLICSRRVLVALTQSWHTLGATIGGVLAYHAQNHIPPRRLMLIGMLGQVFCGNLTGLVDSYQLHIFFRCLTSVFCAFMYISGHVILNDITAGKARIVVVTLSELFWSVGLVLLPAISICFDTWRQLYVAISSSLLVLVLLHRWIAASPRWLLRHQKIDEAMHVLLESATYNNRMVPLNLDAQLRSYAVELAQKPHISYCQLWDGETKHSQLFYIHWIWGSALVLYNIILLIIRTLGSAQVHVNTAALGFAEMVGVFVGLYFILYKRRYWRWAGNLMVIAGLCTYLVWLLPESTCNSRREVLELFFWILLKFANAATIAVLSTCTGEMVSAEKRGFLMLSVDTFSRLCLVFAPLLSTLVVVHRLLPITIIATLGWVYGLVLRLLKRYYWNEQQPQIGQVPTPQTYRNSATLQYSRSSIERSLDGAYSNEGSINSEPNGDVSISDIWHIHFQAANENTRR